MAAGRPVGLRDRQGGPMNHPHVTEEQVRRAEELVSWTCWERIRFLWYRLRLTMREMNYATSLMVMPMFSDDVRDLGSDGEPPLGA
jgi:hypothetical protein